MQRLSLLDYDSLLESLLDCKEHMQESLTLLPIMTPAYSHCEKELIKSTIESEGIICQSGISDRMKSINNKKESLEDFLRL